MSKVEEPIEETLGKTLNIYRELAISMNYFKKAEKVSIRDLAEKADVHYNTAKKAIFFFHQLGSIIPKFEIEESCFRVVSKPNAFEATEGIFESPEMRILTKMMLLRVVDSEKARKLDDLLTKAEREMVSKLIERGLINSIEGKYFLSKRGISLGSMGLSRIVKLNIPLPWENQAQYTGQGISSAPTFDSIGRRYYHSRIIGTSTYKLKERRSRFETFPRA